MIRISVLAGKDRFIFDYEGLAPLTIGRLPSCDLAIAHTDVSREHCTITPDPASRGAFRVVDLGSRNGILVDGQKTQDTRLAGGAVITLAPEVSLTFGEKHALSGSAREAPRVEGEAPSRGGSSKDGREKGVAAAAPGGANGAKDKEATGKDAKDAPPAKDGAAKPADAKEATKDGKDAPSTGERVRRVKERRRESNTRVYAVLGGVMVFLAAIAIGFWKFVYPIIAPKPAEVAGVESPGAAPADAPGATPSTGPSVAELAPDATKRPTEDEKEWSRLEKLDVEPDLMAQSLDAFARRYPTSPHARAALARATSLRKVKAAGGPSAAAPDAKALAGAYEGELDALLKAGEFGDAYYIANAAPRLGAGDKAAADKAARRVEAAAYEKYQKARDDARALASGGRVFDAYEFLAAQAIPLRRLPFYGEAELELRGLRAKVADALAGGARAAAPEGDRSALELLGPQARRQVIGCDFNGALETYRQILALPLADQERLDYQWKIFDVARARQLFGEVLAKIQEKRSPLELTIYMQDHALKAQVTDGDASGITASFKLLEDSKETQEWRRAWKDMTPGQVVEILSGLDPMTGEDLLALASFCFEAEYERDAQAALCRLWDDKHDAAFKPEAAALLRRATGVSASASELLTFEGRLIPQSEKEKILAKRAADKAEAERAKAELAAAKRDASGKYFLDIAQRLIDAGSFVEGRAVLVAIANKFRDVEAGKTARAKWEDPFLRRRAPERTKRPDGMAIANGRDANRLSITALAEGFPVDTNEDQQAFDRFADRQMRILEKADFFKEYDGYLNYYALNLWSKERGLSRDPGGIKKDTPCGGKVDGGVYTVNPGLVKGFLQRFPGPSVGCTIGNDNASVATGGGGCTAIVKGMIDVVAHEVGHAFGEVGDEYDMDPSGKPNGPKGRSTTPLPTVVLRPNLIGGNQKDDLRANAPWRDWIALGDANWTGKKVDIFEGGNRTPFDVYRPQLDCRMRTSTSGYCCVCMQEMVLHLYDVVRPVDEVDPKDDHLEIGKGESVILKVTTLRPRSRPLDGKWTIVDAGDVEAPDGSTVVRQAKEKKLDNVRDIDLPDGRHLYGAKVTATPGIYDVTFTVSDPTPWVIAKERPGLSEKRTWRLKVRAEK